MNINVNSWTVIKHVKILETKSTNTNSTFNSHINRALHKFTFMEVTTSILINPKVALYTYVNSDIVARAVLSFFSFQRMGSCSQA